MRVVRVLAAAVMLVAAGWLVFLYLQGPPDPSQDAPAPAQDLALAPEQARDAQEDTGLDEVVAGDREAGPHVRTDWSDSSDPGPWHIRAVTIGLDTPVRPQGIKDGYMTIPRNLGISGWLETTAPLEPAAEGSSLLAGHVTYSGERGAMYYLGLSRPGQRISTWDADGIETVWVVTQVRKYSKQALPSEIFQPTGVERQLNLVTCGGRLYRSSNGYWYYDSNVVVTAVPLAPLEPVEQGA